MIFHEVKSGETLSSIARDYSTTVTSLILYNGIPNPDNLAVGQCIVIVYPKVIHTVKAGESLYSVAAQYDMSINRLYRNNPQLSRENPALYPGERIVIELEDDILGSFETGGYTYTDTSLSLIDSSMPFMNYLMPFTYGFDAYGNLTELDDERFITVAKKYGRKAFMHLSTLMPDGTFSDAAASVLLPNAMLREKLIDNTLSEMIRKGYDGLDIDFEFIGAKNAENYALFIGEAREKLNSYGYEVFAALAPKTSDDQKGILYEGHLYREIGLAADAVLLMTYEWGYT